MLIVNYINTDVEKNIKFENYSNEYKRGRQDVLNDLRTLILEEFSD